MVQRKLGWLNLLDAVRPYGIKYVLDLNTPEEKEVCKRLAKVAKSVRSLEEPTLQELTVNGRNFPVKEDTNLWSTLLDISGESGDEHRSAVVEFKFKATEEQVRAEPETRVFFRR